MKITGAQKRVVSLLLALAMVLTGVTIIPTQVQAASSSEVYGYYDAIGINETISASSYMSKRGKATYSFTSSKPSVAKVSSAGKITGLKVGSTKITVTEKYKGKKKKLGSFWVTVKKCIVVNDRADLYLQTGYYENVGYQYYCKYDLMYRNPKATYKVYSTNTSKLKISTKGKISYLNAKDGETVNVVIKETYKGKTRTVGKRSFEVYAAEVYEDNIWYVGEFNRVPMDYYYYAYFCWSEAQWTDQEIQDQLAVLNAGEAEDSYEDGNGILKADRDEDGSLYFIPQKTGTVYFYMYLYNYSTKSYEYVGKTAKVTVQEYSDDYDDDEY